MINLCAAISTFTNWIISKILGHDGVMPCAPEPIRPRLTGGSLTKPGSQVGSIQDWFEPMLINPMLISSKKTFMVYIDLKALHWKVINKCFESSNFSWTIFFVKPEGPHFNTQVWILWSYSSNPNDFEIVSLRCNISLCFWYFTYNALNSLFTLNVVEVDWLTNNSVHVRAAV